MCFNIYYLKSKIENQIIAYLGAIVGWLPIKHQKIANLGAKAGWLPIMRQKIDRLYLMKKTLICLQKVI